MKNSDDSGYTGKHVGVCVLDTGIFPHIDFTGRILAFQDFIGHRIRPYDDNSHGTHVCGIIGGDGRASEGRIKGIALSYCSSSIHDIAFLYCSCFLISFNSLSHISAVFSL